jgi:uncharacterized protein YjbI with pentapeptide repeats
MANKEHVRRLNEGVREWNSWRGKERIKPDLSGANLSGANLSAADLSDARLSQADLSFARLGDVSLINADLSSAKLRTTYLKNAFLKGANLARADLNTANLTGADLSGARLTHASLFSTDLHSANLAGANLFGAYLNQSVLRRTYLRGANLSQTGLWATAFLDVNLSWVVGLETCEHLGPSYIDFRTLQNSGPLPLAFLRGVGLPEMLIDYLPSLLNQAIQHFSCFISYSTKDQDFADRLHADLQNSAVRCWFAPHDMPIGGKILDEIDAAIRVRDKVLLILSEHAIQSDWVEDEVTKAFEEERKRGQIVLFPIRLDDDVMETDKAWAVKLRNQRHIGDFRRWKQHDAYRKSFDRVLRDLAVRKTAVE